MIRPILPSQNLKKQINKDASPGSDGRDVFDRGAPNGFYSKSEMINVTTRNENCFQQNLAHFLTNEASNLTNGG